MQEDLSSAQKKENVLKDVDIHKKISEKLKIIKTKIEEDIASQQLEINKQPNNLESHNLTIQELDLVISEYKKPPDKRNYEKIDKASQKLPFFKKFGKTVRYHLMRIASYTEYKTAEVIFRQGEMGEMMYIILRGSVSIEKIASEFGNKEIVVNSLYDGKPFGELALISSLRSGNYPVNRMATIITSEACKLLEIPKVEFNKVVMTELRDEIEIKLRFLEQSKLFKDLDPVHLIPLASDVEVQHFACDEVILEKGEKPKGLYMIMKGHAVAFTEGYKVMGKELSEFANVKAKKSTPRAFYTGNIEPPAQKEIHHGLKIALDDCPIKRALNREKNEATEKT